MPTWLVAIASAAATAAAMLAARAFSRREKSIDHKVDPIHHAGDEQFRRSVGAILGPAIETGNEITAYRNGDEIFPPMLEAIAAARHSITFETFIYWSGSIGQRFADALSERARAGVRVHVILDWFGSKKMDPGTVRTLESAGVQVERYHRARWHSPARANHRTHRKILVIDGHTGFTGGVGIADPWLGNARNPDEWRDTHFRLRGPAVAQLQRAFMDNWLKTHSDVLHARAYFPPPEHAGDAPAHVFMSSAAQGSESARLLFLLSIAAARRDIRIATAYFVPDRLTTDALLDARTRAVRVRVIVPGPRIDKNIVRRASRAGWGRLLEAGVEIHEYQPTMYHCKYTVIDDAWACVGSANFDHRSFRLNDEVNLNAQHAPLARTLTEHFEDDLTHAKQITHEAWRTRPLRERMIEHTAALLRRQL